MLGTDLDLGPEKTALLGTATTGTALATDSADAADDRGWLLGITRCLTATSPDEQKNKGTFEIPSGSYR
jgi:hypothetical protein